MEIYQVLSLLILTLVAISAILPLICFSSGFLRWAVKILVIVFCLAKCFSFISETCAPQPWTPSYNPTVYTTDYGSHYHNAGCGSLWNSAHEKSLCEAVLGSYHRCARCDPPEYSEEQKARIFSSRESSAPVLDEFLVSGEYIVSGIILILLIVGYYHFDMGGKLKSGNHRYIAAVLGNASILLGIFCIPSVTSVFMLLYSAFGAAILIGIPLCGCVTWVVNLFAPKKEPTIIPVKITPSQPPDLPSPVSPPVKPAARSVMSTQDAAPSYRVCHFIWTRSIIFCERFQKNPSLQCETYIWTAFFYSITKHVRNQVLVDEIYAQFKLAAESFIKDGESKAMSLHYIQSTYWRFRSTLNASGIDPRTQVGIGRLWQLTAQWAFPNVQLPEAAEASFSYNIQLLVNHALTIYGLKPPAETVYCMEAANGMTVRVPESKLDAWHNAQEGHSKNPTEEQRKFIKQKILQEIYGTDQQDE